MGLHKHRWMVRAAVAAFAALAISSGWAVAADAAPAGGGPVTFPYKVSAGDQLWYLARIFNTSVGAIRAANSLASDMIYAGQILVIPAGQPDFPGTTNGFLYRVSPGDQLWYLARVYNTTVEAIIRTNHLVSDQIFAGQTLVIPRAGNSPAPASAPAPAPAPAPTPAPAPASASAAPPDVLSNLVFPFAPGTQLWWQDDWGAGREFDANGNPTVLHEGNDLFAPMGTPIRAVAGGTVIRYGWSYYGGWRLTVQSDSGYIFYYAHLSGYAPGIALGSHVKAGQVIGYVGNTGNGPLGASGAFEPHLHLGIYDADWQALNPYPYLRAAELRQ